MTTTPIDELRQQVRKIELPVPYGLVPDKALTLGTLMPDETLDELMSLFHKALEAKEKEVVEYLRERQHDIHPGFGKCIPARYLDDLSLDPPKPQEES